MVRFTNAFCTVKPNANRTEISYVFALGLVMEKEFRTSRWNARKIDPQLQAVIEEEPDGLEEDEN